MIGRIEYLPGRWATLGKDLIWRGPLDDWTLLMLNRDFGPGQYSPADGPHGADQIRRAAEEFGIPYEFAPQEEPPEGAVD